MSSAKKIRPKERDAILQSIRAGVVPRIGIHHIQVGRVQEVQSLLNDINRIRDEGSTIRFIIGEYGAGKTFFLHLIRTVALEKSIVTAHADLNPTRRLYGSGGLARNLFAELMRNMSTRTKPNGGALPSVIERFISSAIPEARDKGVTVESVITARLAQLSEMVGGYDFAHVVAAYWKGYESDNEQLKQDAIRWLRGEFSTKTDARVALGVRTIIDDVNMYDYLKLMALFVRLSGYNGFLVGLDEMVTLYKLANTRSRNSNYEQLLRILNDSLQGIATGLGFLLCGTPEFLMDTRRGLYSYQALQSRLAENTFAKQAGVIDQSGPVIRLANLTQEDLYVLLTKLRHVFASGQPENYLVPDDALVAFMSHCSKRIGDAYFRTPRTTSQAFIQFLDVLKQDPQRPWQSLLQDVIIECDIDVHQDDTIDDNDIVTESTPTTDSQDTGDDLAHIRI